MTNPSRAKRTTGRTDSRFFQSRMSYGDLAEEALPRQVFESAGTP